MMSGFLAALVVSVIAGCGGLCPIFLAAAYRPGMLSVSALAATVLRLLLMIAGSAVIILCAKVNTLWFAAWIGVFYFITLVLEIRFAIRAAHGNNVLGGGRV